MSAIERARRREAVRQISETLLEDSRREVLKLLLERDGPIPESELIERLPNVPRGSTAGRAGSCRGLVELYERHLPALVENGLIHWDKDDQTVAATDHPVYHEDCLPDLVSPAALDRVAAVLESDRRRATVAYFDGEDGPTTRDTIAHWIATMEADGAPSDGLIDDIGASLHVRHLPTLERIGLVDYDYGTATLTYEGPQELPTVLRQRGPFG